MSLPLTPIQSKEALIWDQLRLGLIGSIMVLAGVGLALRGLAGAPAFEALRVAEGSVATQDEVRVKSTTVLDFTLSDLPYRFSFPDWAPGYGSVRAAATSAQTRLQVWYDEPTFSGRTVWQVSAGDAIIVPYSAMVEARSSGYVIDEIFGALFAALGGFALGAIALRAWRRVHPQSGSHAESG